MSGITEAEKSLSYFCKSHSSFKEKLGILLLYKAHFPSWFEKILLTIEYIQLFSLTILIHPSVYKVSCLTIQDSYIFEVVAYAIKLANPSYLLSFTRSDPTTNAVLGIILGYLLFKHILLSYVIYISWFNKTPNPLLKTIWRWLFKLQGRIACCFITSFWVRTIVMTSNDTFSIHGISNRALIAISAVLIIIEYTISFLLETQLCNFIPTKNYLSSKNFDMPIITLLQKLVIQVIQLFAYKNFSASIWVFITLNLILSFLRAFRFFMVLPYYTFRTLLCQGDLVVIALSLHFTHFFQQILNEADYLDETDFRFIIITWILIGILSCKLSRALVKQIYIQLLTSPYDRKCNPNLLLHRVFATKYIISNTKMPTHHNDKTDLKHLLGITQSLNLSRIFNLQAQKISYNLLVDKREDVALIILEYLQNLTHQFPKNPLLQLNLAYQNSKSTQFHSKIIKIASKLNENILSPYHVSSVLLLCDLEMQNFNQLSDLEEKNSLDLINYIDHQLAMQDLCNNMLKQIALRKQICQHIVGEKADLETIYQNAQRVYRSKTLIQKKISTFLKRTPEYYLHPYLVFAEYSLYLNYSIEDYYTYNEKYTRKLTRFTKEFAKNSFSEENLYQDENAFLVISTDKLENSSVVYSTKSLQGICGSDRNHYIDTPLARLFPHCLREYYTKMFKEIFEQGQTEFTNQSIPAFLLHKEGWLIEVDIFVRVHPYMSQNLYLDLLIRPHLSMTEAILLDETGKIEGATQNIHQLIKADPTSVQSSIHIKQISEELADLNTAFNTVNPKTEEIELRKRSSSKKKMSSFIAPTKLRMPPTSPEPSPMDLDKALRIYNLYTEEHKSIELPIPPNNRTFKCQISSLDFNSFSLNFIKLEGVVNNKNTVGGHRVDSSVSHDSTSLQDLGDLEEIKQTDNIDSNREYLLTTREFKGTIPTERDEPELKSHNFENNETDENLLISPTTSRLFLKNTQNDTPDLKTKTETNPTNNFKSSLKLASSLSVGSAESSKMSQISGVFKTFQRAINTKSYQKSFNFLCLIFYGVILGTLICQIILKSVLDTTMDRLIIKTNLLNFAQTRAQQICAIQNNARGCKMVFLGQVTSATVSIYDASLRESLKNFIVPEQYLTEANYGITNNLASEDDEIQQLIFKRGVRLQGTVIDPTDTSVSLITTLQHGDIMKSTIKYLNNLPVVASTAGSNGFQFILNNVGNDFLVRNQEIIDAFQASVNDQRDRLQSMINLSVIVLPILLAGIVCLLAVIIFKQYTKEKRHLLAFLKLNPAMIQSVLENLKMFENRLIQQEKLKEELLPKLVYQLDTAAQFTNYHKAHDSQVVVSGGMQKRYIFYIVKVLFYIALLIAIVIINYVLISNSTDHIYLLQRQIQFANYIGSTGAITYIAHAEAYMTNNTAYVMGKLPYDQWKIGIKKWNQIQEDIFSEFQLEDGSYDPDVKAILFEPADCSLFIASALTTCLSLSGLGYPSDMISLINLYKNMLDYKLLLYDAVDKTNAAKVLGAAVTGLNSILAGYRVSNSQALLLSGIISKKLEKSVHDIHHLGTTILVTFSVTLLIASILVWFQILTKVKRVNDDFKKVLAVLPPNIILSSFLLKSFLNKTSSILQKL